MVESVTSPLVIDTSGEDIQGEIVRIREQGRATLVELPGGVQAWSITDAALLEKLLVDSRVSKDAGQHWPAFVAGQIPPDWPLYLWVAAPNMFTAYGADHRRLRKLVAPAFTARRTEAMRGQVERITKDLLDALAATPAGEIVDLREQFAYPLPIQVISELMGVPESLGPGLRTCVDGIFDTTLTPEQSQANYMEMYRILGELVALRREQPGDDMTSLLISHRDEDEDTQLTEEELVGTLLLVISAGHETTVNLLDQAITALLTRPEVLARLRDGSVKWPELVEETLRFESPVAHLPLRFAVTDIEIDGIRIAQGEAILAGYAGAGRDPRRHGATADEFDPTRDNQSHMAFGYGAHHCLGAPLARLEALVSLPALFERFPAMTLAAPVSELGTVPSFISNGHHHLPVRLGE
ncbi:cytochrome P450 family protein [Nocardia mangyaensis]|uniref:cytochrome P450 family protein n=1 Tax=Nocardia mangyaensis TaxID=2213200 RepID=UPI00267765DC|nr:cytochrome P450 [Nocardia mangyaensis]MDO3647876.1 cytochrome P450 [Nocardia mangyaensis]